MSRIHRTLEGQNISPEALFIFSVLALLIAVLLQFFMELLFAILIALVLAGILERIIIDLWDAPYEEVEEKIDEKRKENVRKVMQTTQNCMSCMKSLDGQLECPHCGYDMSDVIKKHDG